MTSLYPTTSSILADVLMIVLDSQVVGPGIARAEGVLRQACTGTKIKDVA